MKIYVKAKEFEQQLSLMKKMIEQQPVQVMRAATRTTFQRIVNRTPVKTGAARNNWSMGVGAKVTATRGPDTDGSEALQDIIAKTAKMGMDKPVYLTNRLAYVERLENGSSKQAPVGMVAVTLAEFPSIFKTAARTFFK